MERNPSRPKKSSVPSSIDAEEAADRSPVEEEAKPEPPQGFDEDMLPWPRDELRDVFRRYSDNEDREVRADRLTAALSYLGIKSDEDEVKDIVQRLTPYATLDWQEFLDFMHAVRKLDLARIHAEFHVYDRDGNGEIDLEELHQLLLKGGYSPTIASAREALRNIDRDCSGAISFGEFEELREQLRATQGFTKAEAEMFRAVFDDFADGDEQSLSIEIIQRVVFHLGYHTRQQDVMKIVCHVAEGRDGVTRDEFLKVMSEIRGVERDVLLKVAAIYARPPGVSSEKVQEVRKTLAAGRRPTRILSWSFDTWELISPLADLGYFVSHEVIAEILEDEIQVGDKDHITVEEIEDFLRVYRRREGFTKEELKELEEAFARCQQRKDPTNRLMVSRGSRIEGTTDAIGMGHLLRHFGFARNLQQRQHLIEIATFNGRLALEFKVVLKLLRTFLHEEGRRRKKFFNQRASPGSSMMLAKHLDDAVKRISGSSGNKYLMSNAGKGKEPYRDDDDISYSQYQRFLGAYGKLAVGIARTKAGFMPFEVEELRHLFESYDVSGTGSLDAPEMRTMVADFVPESKVSIEGKEKALQLLPELKSSRNQHVNFDFSGFLGFIRRCLDIHDETDLHREREVVRECEFSSEQVKGLRAAWTSSVGLAGKLRMGKVLQFLRVTVDISREDPENIWSMVEDLCPSSTTSLRFPEVLVLVKKILRRKSLVQGETGFKTATLHAVRKNTWWGRGGPDDHRSGNNMDSFSAKRAKKRMRRKSSSSMDVHLEEHGFEDEVEDDREEEGELDDEQHDDAPFGGSSASSDSELHTI